MKCGQLNLHQLRAPGSISIGTQTCLVYSFICLFRNERDYVLRYCIYTTFIDLSVFRYAPCVRGSFIYKSIFNTLSAIDKTLHSNLLYL